MRLRGVTTAPPCLAPKPLQPPSNKHHRVAQLAPSVQHHLDALRWVPCPSQLVVYVCEALIDITSTINLSLSLSITGGQDVSPSVEVVLTTPPTSPTPSHSQARQLVHLLQTAAKQHQCWLGDGRVPPTTSAARSVPLGSVLCSAPTRAISAPSVLLASSVVCKGAMLNIPCLKGALDLKTGNVHRTSSSSSTTTLTANVFASLHLTGILCVSTVREAHAAASLGKGGWFDDIQPAAYSILLSRLIRIPSPLPPSSIRFSFPAPPPAWPFTAVVNSQDAAAQDPSSLLLHCIRVCFPESAKYFHSRTFDLSYRGVSGQVDVVVCEPPHPGEETSFSISSLPPLRVFFVGGDDNTPPSHPLHIALTSIRGNATRGYERRCRQLNKRVAGCSSSNDAALTAALALHHGGKRMREAARAEDGDDGVEDPLESGAVPCAVVVRGMDDPTGVQGKREVTISVLRVCGLTIPQSLMMPEERNLRPHHNNTTTTTTPNQGFGIDYSKVDRSIPPTPTPPISSPTIPDITAPSPMCFLASPDMASVFANLTYLSSTPLSGGFPTRPFSQPQRPPPSPVRMSHSDGSFSVAVYSTPQANTATYSSSHTTTPLLSPRLTTPVMNTPSGRHTTTTISRTPLADRQASLVSLLSSPPPMEASSAHLPTNIPPQLPRVSKSSFSFRVAGEECPSSHTMDNDEYSYALPVGLQVAGLQPSAQLHRELFAPDRCRVLGQWDKKFIIASISTPPGQVLVCLDQHAVHERVRLEYFMASLVEYCQPTPIPPAQGGHLSIPPHLLAHVSKYRLACEYWGWRFDIHTSKITHCPCVIIEGHSYTLSKWYHVDSAMKDLQGCVGGGPEGPFPAPSCIVQIAVLRSCRGAVMFGHEMSMEQCCGIVHALPLVQQYTVCSHGRTSIMPLTEVCHNQ